MKPLETCKLLLVLLAAHLGCESRYEAPHEVVPLGGLVSFEKIVSPVLDVSHLESSRFEASVYAPANNVREYRLYVRREGCAGTSDRALLQTVTSFPGLISFTAATVAKALDFEVEEIAPGERLLLFAEVVRHDGSVFTAADFTGDLFNPGMRQAMEFAVPFIVSEAEFSGLDVRYELLTATDPDGNDLMPLVAATRGTLSWEEASGKQSYTWNTFSFGIFEAMNKCCEQQRGESILEVATACKTLSISPADEEGCAWQLYVDRVNGPEMQLTLDGQGNCFGSITLSMSRTDGKEWALVPNR